MVSVEEAGRIILEHLYEPRIEKVPLTISYGRILAEEVRADRDLPPFNRATMDGIAIAYESFEKDQYDFLIEGVQAAGQTQLILSDKKNCIEIMTGASLPIGTDTVVPYESIKIENRIAKVFGEISINQNVHPRGSDVKQNEIVVSQGLKISPAEIALLASLGKSEVNVFKNPSCAVISTGDELVDVDKIPLPHQVRKSNSYAIAAALAELGCSADLFHLIDNETVLKEKLKSILLNYELIILSGGVSKGKFDFIPKVLESLGVKKLFHQISQRPGKPMWFGHSKKNIVFALPGNPVSTFMCFYRYVKPWLLKSLGSEVKNQSALLAEDFSFSSALTYFLQVKIKNEDGKLLAHPIIGGGSGDFANLKEVDGFLELPLKETDFKKGQSFSFFNFR